MQSGPLPIFYLSELENNTIATFANDTAILTVDKSASKTAHKIGQKRW